MVPGGYKNSIRISSKDISIPLDIYSEGIIKLKFVVRQITKNDDETFGNEEETYYDLSCDLINIDVDKPNLERAAERAKNAPPVLVKNNINPAP